MKELLMSDSSLFESSNFLGKHVIIGSYPLTASKVNSKSLQGVSEQKVKASEQLLIASTTTS